MSFIPKKFGPTLPLGAKPIQSKMFGRNNDLKFSLRLAEIIRVDYENMVCDLAYLQGSTPIAEEVPISSAYWSKRGFLGAMPEKGAICIVGNSAVHQDSGFQPLILAFLPNGYKTALRYDPFGYAPRNAEELDVPIEVAATELEGYYGVERRKFRKIYPGTIYGTSKEGSEIILDSDIRLYDKGGQEIILRDEDSSAILTTKDLYLTTASGRSRSGRIVRNGLNIPTDFLTEGILDENNPLFEVLLDKGLIFEDGSLVSDINSYPSITLPSGKKSSYITLDASDPNHISSLFYTENRKEIQEFSDNTVPFSDSHGFDADVLSEDPHFQPFIETVLGTVVGNDPYSSKGRSQYGQILKPVLFNTEHDRVGDPRLEPVQDENDLSLAAAGLYRMKRPDNRGELFLAHDKEGHVFLSIPSSTSNSSNLGGGRSVEADLKGSLKMTLGGDSNKNQSLDLDSKGGMSWNIGSFRDSARSLEMTSKGGILINVLSPDSEGNALKNTLRGNVDTSIQGNLGVSIRSDYYEEVQGLKESSSESLSVQVGTGDYNLNVISSHNINVNGDYNSVISQDRLTTILLGNDETSLLAGNSKTEYLIPSNHEVLFETSGTYKIEANASLTIEQISQGQGSYSFEALSGSYSVNLTTGSIDLVAGAGSVSISTAGIDIKAPQINLQGNVGLGSGSSAPNAVIGGIPGPSPHLDYITGLPLLGNPLVRTV